MKNLVVFDIPALRPQKWQGSISDAYLVFRNEKDAQYLNDALHFIANYEYNTFLQLLDRYYPSREWVEKLNFMFLETPEIVKWNHDNYILKMLGDDDFSEDARYCLDNIGTLSDIYEKDFESFYDRVFILAYNGRYVSHVYHEKPYRDDEAGLIGIRSSLYNQLSSSHGLVPIKNVGYILLDAYRNWGIKNNKESIMISNPIGSMIKISRRYGFKGPYFKLTETPSVEIPQYEILHYD